MTKSALKSHDNSQQVTTLPLTTFIKTNKFNPAKGTPPKPTQRDPRLKRPLNSRRTGGLNTSEGRARSSLNPVKHGGYVTAKTAGLG